MAAANFNINKTDVYYTLIDNEVYAIRFKALLVSIHSLSERELRISDDDMDKCFETGENVIVRGRHALPFHLNKSKMVLFSKEKNRKFSNKEINYILAEIAPLGEERVWKRYGNDKKKSFNPYHIHRTIKDCVDDVNPVFIRNNDKLWPTQEYEISLDEVTPNSLLWESTLSPDIYGLMRWDLRTWVWNGYHPVKDKVYTIHNRMGFYDSYNYPLFDLLDGKFLFDEDRLEHSYSKPEECARYNSIAVHLFVNKD